ncbi:MAG: sulfotransferase domain-containing protein [Planctomycetota bacterium]
MNDAGCNPTFLGLGAAKCGTTTLSKLLAEHPEVAFPKCGLKELHYFDETPVNEATLATYRAEFTPGRVTGEWTPSYLLGPSCPTLIADHLGTDLRLLVMLRDPCDRAWSHYWHAVKNWSRPGYRERGYPEETLSFEDALAAEPQRLASGAYHIRHQSYFSKGLYAEQLERYVDRFGRDRIWVGLLEDLRARPRDVIQSCCHFLQIDPAPLHLKPVVRLNAQSEDTMPAETRDRLAERYRPSIDRLERRLGIGLDAWKTSTPATA